MNSYDLDSFYKPHMEDTDPTNHKLNGLRNEDMKTSSLEDQGQEQPEED